MSITVTCAGNVVEDPELLCNPREGKPFVGWRVLVKRQVENDEGEWVNVEPAPHDVKVDGSAATHVHDSCGYGDPIFVCSPDLRRGAIDPGGEAPEERDADPAEAAIDDHDSPGAPHAGLHVRPPLGALEALR